MVDWDRAVYEALQNEEPRGEVLASDRFLREVESLREENEILKEDMEQVRLMFQNEDRGWMLISGVVTGEREEGLSLEDVQKISKTIQPHVVADGMVKRGSDLHTGYVWSKGMSIDGVNPTGGRGRPTALMTFFKDLTNQDNLFSDAAHGELQRARFSDGNVFLYCDTTSRKVRRIPLHQIKGIRVNPDFPDEIWAYKRAWHPDGDATGKPKVRWIYTNRYKGARQKSFTENGQTVLVDESAVIVDRRFNRQIGFPLGIPDSIAMMVWVAAYTEIVNYGRVVNESLAKILYKVVSKTKAGAETAGVRIRNMQGAGNTASMMAGQDIQAVSTAGKGYEFANARPVASMAAMSINVPNIELLADSSAAGSSYGAASTLTPSTKNAMRLMQGEWIALYQEVFEVFNLGDPRIWFEPLDDADLYRESQSLTLLSVTLKDEEYRAKALDLLNIVGDPKDIPESLKMRSQPQAAAQQAAPDQGQSNGTNSGGQGANDQRTDTISQTEALRSQMANEDLLLRWEAVAARLEGAS